MISHLIRAPLFVIFLAFAALSCHRDLPDSLIVIQGASKPKQFYVRGMDQIVYRVEEKFPAKDAIQTILQQLKKKGWEPLQQQYLYPDLPSSHVLGWTFYEDKRVGYTSFVFEWSADWKDKNNNIVTYSFRYRDPAKKYTHKTYILKPTNSDLYIAASYMPEKVAQTIRESAKQRKPKSTQKVNSSAGILPALGTAGTLPASCGLEVRDT